MKRTLLIISLVLCATSRAVAQNHIEEYESNCQYRVGFGLTMHAKEFLKYDRFSDYGFKYSDQNIYVQAINFSYFPWRRFGFEVNMINGISNSNNIDIFEERFRAEYSDYIITNEEIRQTITNSTVDFAAVFRYEKSRFYCYPKLSVGCSFMTTKELDFDLKRKIQMTHLT